MSPRETRYRRLLALYPADFRREYADEMLGVLMADSRPARGHAVNLVAGAVAAHFRQTLGGSAWRRAAQAVQLFGAILLCAVSLRRFLLRGALAFAGPTHGVPRLADVDLVRALAWAAVVAAAFAGLRWVATAAALVGLGGEIAAPLRLYADTPAMFLDVYWIVLAAAVVLTASVFAARGQRPRGWLPVVAAGLVLIGSGTDAVASYRVAAALSGHAVGPRMGVTPTPALVLGAVLLAAAGVARLDGEVRRRVIACAVPVVGAFPLVRYAFAGFEEFNQFHPESLRLLDPAQWAALVLVPAVAFWVAARLNMRLERSRAGAAGTAPPPGAGPTCAPPVRPDGAAER